MGSKLCLKFDSTIIQRTPSRKSRRNIGHEALHSEKIVSDRKIFFLDLKENDRGRFIKITEDVRGRRDTIMLPMEVAEEFLDALQRCVEVDHEAGGHPED